MATFGAVLDTCVLYPMPLADTLLLAAQRGLYAWHWTEDLLTELERVMVERGLTQAQARRRVTIMRKAFAETEVTGYRKLIPALSLPDSDDRHVLAAAIREKVERIVTFNLKHFPPTALEEYDIEAYHPDNFLLDTIDLFPDQVLDILRYQAARLKNPPTTFEQLLLRLEPDVPRFIAQVRQVVVWQQRLLASSQQSADAEAQQEGILPFTAPRKRRAGRKPPHE